jgi:hypothetical protein
VTLGTSYEWCPVVCVLCVCSENFIEHRVKMIPYLALSEHLTSL